MKFRSYWNTNYRLVLKPAGSQEKAEHIEGIDTRVSVTSASAWKI